MDRSAIAWVTEAALQTLASGGAAGPAALRLLVREYATTGRGDVADALGSALGRALASDVLAGASPDGAQWLALFVEAASVSDDDRLADAVAALVACLRREWPSRGRVADAARAIEICLDAARLRAAGSDARELVAASIDEMERVIGLTYEPGNGVARELSDPRGVRGSLADQLHAAGALLTAYGITGRLPYSMLADELVQYARRMCWDDSAGVFQDERAGGCAEREAMKESWFRLNCEAARVLCRLAALHADPEYQRAAVLPASSDYATDAERALDRLASVYREQGAEAAAGYALVVGEFLQLSP